MASAFGLAVTNLTSKFGILSRKACIRIATETGKKVADKSKEVGRMVSKEEIEQIFAQTVPKRCRPKLITTNEEAIDVFRRTGHTEEEISQFMSMPFSAAVLENGTRKYPIWIPFEKFETGLPELKMFMSSTVGHELEHALEKNHRIRDIFRRKFSGVKESVCKFFDKDYKRKVIEREMGIHKFEEEIQQELLSCFDMKTRKFVCEPTVESIEKHLQEKTGKGLIERLRENVRRNYASPKHSGSEQAKRFDKINYWLDVEKPAYQVTGEVDRYYFGTPKGETFLTEAISPGYEAAIDIVKKDRRSYWKNKLFGKLKKPNVFTTDKDLLKHATTPQEKQMLQELISGLNKEQKSYLIKVLCSFEGQPNSIKTIKTFLEKTSIKGKNVYLEQLGAFEGIDSQILSNPDFIKIAKIANSKVKNSDEIVDLIYSMTHSNKTDSKLLRIYAGKLQKAIRNKSDIRTIVEQYYNNTCVPSKIL